MSERGDQPPPEAGDPAPDDNEAGTPEEAFSKIDSTAAAEESDPLGGHDPGGLDLARQLARSVARSRPATGGSPGDGGKAAGSRRKKPPGRKRRTIGGQVSGAFPDDRDPQTIEDLVGRLVEDHGWAVDLKVQGIFARWEELVGPDVAQHCRPESVTDGKLTVRTDSTAWATQLRLLAPTLQRRLNVELGADTVRTVVVIGPTAPNWRKGPRRVPGKGPGDTYG